MNYLVPFSIVKNSIRVSSTKGQLKVDLGYDEFLMILRQLLLVTPIDEQWYRTTYPDVAEAIDAGTYRDAKHHFIEYGYLEGRRPFPMEVDEDWYVEQYPDLKSGLEKGVVGSAREHFESHGYSEGRLPGPL